MPPASQAILQRLVAAYGRGERLVLVFDYDGTLTPLVAHPRLAHLDPALRGVLARLTRWQLFSAAEPVRVPTHEIARRARFRYFES